MNKHRGMAEVLRTTHRSLSPEYREVVASEIDRLAKLEDGIRALADRLDEQSCAYNAMWKDGFSQHYEGRSDQTATDARALRALLDVE